MAANYYDDGPGPAEGKIDDYDKEEDERDAVVANHWSEYAQIIETDCVYPVVLTRDLDNAIVAVLNRTEPVRALALREVPRFGRNNFDGQLDDLPVVFVNGDELENIKERFRGRMVNVQYQNEVRTAFAPDRARRSRAEAPAPVPSSAALPIRDGPPTPRRRDDERRDDQPRREERREEQPRRREERREEQPRRREERREDPPRREERREEQPRRREERREEQPRRREERREESPPRRRRVERREESPPPRRRVLTEEERRRRGL